MHYLWHRCLHLACSVGNLPIANHLIECGANLNAKDRWGSTPLADAIRENHVELAKHMIKQGAELNATNLEASSELCEHARNADIVRVRVLLDGGLNYNAADCTRDLLSNPGAFACGASCVTPAQKPCTDLFMVTSGSPLGRRWAHVLASGRK